jgi:hypothetical protein
VFFDFGPVFEDWEADLGRTYVLGNDPIKARIRQDIEEAWHVAKAHFMATPDITGAALYRFDSGDRVFLLSRNWSSHYSTKGELLEQRYKP